MVTVTGVQSPKAYPDQTAHKITANAASSHKAGLCLIVSMKSARARKNRIKSTPLMQRVVLAWETSKDYAAKENPPLKSDHTPCNLWGEINTFTQTTNTFTSTSLGFGLGNNALNGKFKAILTIRIKGLVQNNARYYPKTYFTPRGLNLKRNEPRWSNSCIRVTAGRTQMVRPMIRLLNRQVLSRFLWLSPSSKDEGWMA